jgi:paraquat-inducible protein B
MPDAGPQDREESPFPVARVQSQPTPGQMAGVVVSRLWFATLACLLVALVLVWLQVRSGGPVIDVNFSQGHGLEPGDPVRFRGIDVGRVSEIDLNDTLDGVVVRIQLSADAAALAREGSRFWVERPDISVGQIRGLDTLMGGRYVGVVPGPADAAACHEFYGLDIASAPIENLADGLEIVLEGAKRFGLQSGSPISYRGVIVGHILSVGLTNDAATVESRAFIQPNYRELIRENSRFWSTSGLDVKIGLSGIELDAETLATIAAGGVAFATPNEPGRHAATGHRFELSDSPRDEWVKWRPRVAIGSAALPSGAATPRALLGNRRQRGAMAVLGAGRQRGWLLPLSDGRLLGPANVLAPTGEEAYYIEVSGREFSLPLEDLKPFGELAACSLPAELEADVESWPVAKVRTAENPEEVIVTCGSDDMTMPISTERLTLNESPETPYWSVDPSIPLDDQWHGASVVAVRDGQVIGILLRSDDRSRIVPLAAGLLK